MVNFYCNHYYYYDNVCDCEYTKSFSSNHIHPISHSFLAPLKLILTFFLSVRHRLKNPALPLILPSPCCFFHTVGKIIYSFLIVNVFFDIFRIHQVFCPRACSSERENPHATECQRGRHLPGCFGSYVSDSRRLWRVFCTDQTDRCVSLVTCLALHWSMPVFVI